MARQLQGSLLFILPSILLLLLDVTPPTGAKKRTQEPVSRSAVPSSGELSTKGGHSCTWAAAAEGSEGVVSLQVNCSSPAGGGAEDGDLLVGEGEGGALGVAVKSYSCRFTAKPELCAAYTGARANQYWKQVVGKLKKRLNACDGERVLKTRLCKKGPPAAHVKLVDTSREGEERRREAKKQEKEKLKQRQREEREKERREKESAAAAAMPVAKETEVSARRLGREEGRRGDRDGLQELNDAPPDAEVSHYCASGWHSLCSFFVKFFDG